MGGVLPFGESSGGSQQGKQGVILTPSQVELDATQVAIAKQQQENIAAQTRFQAGLFEDFPGLIDEQVAEAERASLLGTEEQARGRTLAGTQQAFIESGGRASPVQESLIGDIANRAIASGQSDIRASARDNLEILREELAGSLGLRSTDTPILDRGARVAEESLRQESQLINAVRGAESQALLDQPFRLSEATTQQQSLAEATRQFQEQLRQQAFANRLQLTSQIGGQGLGLASLSVPFATPSPVAETRFRTDEAAGFGEIAGGVGGLLEGVGSLAGFF